MKKNKVCFKCGHKFYARSNYQRYCNDCYNNNQRLKGGEDKMSPEQKAEKADKPKKTDSSKGITADRIEKAKKILTFMKTDLQIENKGLTKVISRLYNIAKNK